jgi:hypothetical protein
MQQLVDVEGIHGRMVSLPVSRPAKRWAELVINSELNATLLGLM